MGKAVIIGSGLSLGYQKGTERKEVLSDLGFSLYSGQMTCLLGPNGVGKSTLLRAIMGRLDPWKGKLELKGKAISAYKNLELSRLLSVVLTEPLLPGNMTVGQLVALGRTPYLGWAGKLDKSDLEAVNLAMEATKIMYLKDELVGKISDGQRQKALIARALAQDCPVMILDEPTAHLDLVNRYEVMQLLRDIAHEQDKAILVVTHDLEIGLELGNIFWLLNCGTPMLAGTPEDLVLTGELNQLFPAKNIHFSLERGRVEFNKQDSKLDISGPPEWCYWVNKAILKAGVLQLTYPLHVQKEPFTLKYEDQQFRTIKDFLGSLEK